MPDLSPTRTAGAAEQGQQAVARGPVEPSAAATVALRPLGFRDVQITGGFWAARQAANAAVSIPHGGRRLREAGNLANLRAAASGEVGGEYRGPVFMDSDVYKWLEAVAWEYGRTGDQGLLAELEFFGRELQRAQRPDGYINSWVQVNAGDAGRYRDLAFGHELYCAGHLIQAGVAAHRTIGDCALWRVTLRIADHLVDTFGSGKRQGIDGHPIVEMALVELFRESDDPRYLDLAEYFVLARGHGLIRSDLRDSMYFSDRVDTREADTLEGHAVRAVYLAAGVADLVAEGRDPGGRLAAAQHRQWADLVERKVYLTGGIGSRWDGEAIGAPYELPPDTAYCESCAAIGSVQWNFRLLLTTGDVRYADLIERTLYNGFVAGMSLAGDAYFYVNTLQVRTGAVPDDVRQPANGRHGWYGVACCPTNIMRALAYLQSYVATRCDDGLQVHQYLPARLVIPMAGEAVTLRVETDYPWAGDIDLTVENTPHAEWELALRIPGWCSDASVTLTPNGDGAARRMSAAPGYARVRRRWSSSDRVQLRLPMDVRLTRANPRVDAVRGCRAIERGPLVYCLEQVDQPCDTLVDDLMIIDGPLATQRAPELLGGCVTITGRGALSDASTEPLYQGAQTSSEDGAKPIDLTAVPYALWANRDVGAMRVWIPVAGPSSVPSD